MASSSESSTDTINIDYDSLQELICINLPFYCKKIDTAVNMLGGSDLVENSIKNNSKFIQIKYPNTDPLRHHVVGTKQTCNGIILKIKRNKVTKQIIHTNLLGKTTEEYNFNEPADYQFLPQSTSLGINGSNQESSAVSHSILETIPRPFAKTVPFNTPSLFIDRKYKKVQSLSANNTIIIQTQTTTPSEGQNSEGNEGVIDTTTDATTVTTTTALAHGLQSRKIGQPMPIPYVYESDIIKSYRSTTRGVKLKVYNALIKLFQTLPSKYNMFIYKL